MNDDSQKPRRGRPPKEPQTGRDTRESLVRSGMAALTERGYLTSDIGGILRNAGVPKGSFYYYFASKEAFVREIILRYGDYFAGKLDRFLLDASMPPLQRIRAFCEDAGKSMARHGFARGCLIGNLSQEAGGLPEGYGHLLNAVFEDWQARVAVCLRLAQTMGEMAEGGDCDELAAYFWTGWEGAVMRAKLVGNQEPLALFVKHFMASITVHPRQEKPCSKAF